ncbi:hypothetical protein STEG23_015590 [Scotinomys teguina]
MYIYTMEYYTEEKNNVIMKFVGKWMELENILREVTQTQKDKHGLLIMFDPVAATVPDVTSKLGSVSALV